MRTLSIYATISAVLVAASWAQGDETDEDFPQQDAEVVGDCTDEQWDVLQCPFSQSCCIFSTFFVLQQSACCETEGDNCCGSEARYYDEFYACTPKDDLTGDFCAPGQPPEVNDPSNTKCCVARKDETLTTFCCAPKVDIVCCDD